jgi:hypothetical protein
MKQGDLKSQNGLVMAPRVLLTDTDRRPYAARMALVLADAGCEVSAICSSQGHPLLKTRVVRKTYPYSSLRPLNSLVHAIEATAPEVIIPCDDRGTRHLHELYEWTRRRGTLGSKLAGLIERSLGSPESYSIVSARYDLLRCADKRGLRVPHTKLVRTPDDLKSWQAEQPFPWVLKADETWGGRGVRIVHTLEEAERVFLEMSRQFRLLRAIKRMLVNHDPFWLQPWWEGRKPAVIVQAHVPGTPANCAVVCWEGKVLAGIGVEVVSADGVTGPASIVRVVDNSKMMLSAERITGELRLSGFFGLDFVIEEGSGEPYLIEMNPRCTPLCHLRLGTGRDMIGGLWAQISGEPVPLIPPVTENDMIAYFPQAWNSKSEFFQFSFHDVPQGEPELVRELLEPWADRSLASRIFSRLHHGKGLTSDPVRPGTTTRGEVKPQHGQSPEQPAARVDA